MLVSDGSAVPRPLIRQNAIERIFGSDIYDTLSQPDHWCMIDAGWFDDTDLFMPLPQGDPAYLTWCECYRPEVEAFDILLDIFGERALSPFGLIVPEFDLTLAEHPSTPRFATATVEDASVLPELAKYVASRAEWVTIDPSPQRPIHEVRPPSFRDLAKPSEKVFR
ncbi:hypothetical protein [uncultured Roseovarius sp.]|uniref:hypothetical protein n=1 Tax=uncultured Roseovarius sp. TaxID=293344 RepID=UPI0025F28584|nr:hypothetical protein [uncultured Roseovarius sp.]